MKIHEDYIKQVVEKAVFGTPTNCEGLVTYYDKSKKSRLKHARLTFWWTILIVSIAILVCAIFLPDYITRAMPKA